MNPHGSGGGRQTHFSPLSDPPPPSALYQERPSLDANLGRKKSLVRPDREKLTPGHRQFFSRAHSAKQQDDLTGKSAGIVDEKGRYIPGFEKDLPELNNGESSSGKSFWSCCSIKDPWMLYCYAVTICVPPFLLTSCGIRTPEQQRAWREKIGLLSHILLAMAGVGFLTFGFTQAVCGTPPTRFQTGTVGNASVIVHGYAYDFSHFKHPAVGADFNGETNPLIEGNWSVAGGDISFMFQNVGGHCKGLITAAGNSTITSANGDLQWYFPCNVYNQVGTSGVNQTGYGDSTNCHITSTARNGLASMTASGQVYYTWDDLQNPKRNLAVFESNVIDFSLLNWLSRVEVNYPAIFDELKSPNGSYNGRDITMQLYKNNQKNLGLCFQDILTVGFIDSNTIGCIASEVVLVLSLVFIIGVVAIKFAMAVMFGWFLSWRLGAFTDLTYEQRMQRAAEIERWTDDIYRPAPSRYRPSVPKNGEGKNKKHKSLLPSTSRFTPQDRQVSQGGNRPKTLNPPSDFSPRRGGVSSTSYPSSLKYPSEAASFQPSPSFASLGDGMATQSRYSRAFNDLSCPFPLANVVPQPAPDYQPFNYPLAHTICLVTAYSESVEGLRTTLDSLATTDYPNSHKLILVIADGIVKGAGNDMTTPDIVLTMMTELLTPAEEVEPHSYVAIADGHKRHNMAKIYAGYYSYDDATVEVSKQQRVPMILVAKCGNPLEANDPKPGNRGKRDSQIVLMAFLQKVMFDERMTTMEYEFFNAMWRVTGVSPDRYELVLCVDADTKAFPDSLSRMVSCMVRDHEIMGICGETKIANKAETWVTMIQVFEYYISHHLTKAFESMFGGVTCLPGCFSMYRIKVPKGDSGYWVPILANPDVVEHYSENIVDTLHKKNLLLLGEDRYLTTLMLKTFPKRKNIFCPQAVCKTVVPDTFRILLSQRRRWINSTVHNLAELLLVRDLCGTFCFSMQFVVFMELMGTLVLPAAICFTYYLIIITIIPGGTNTTIPLILLGIILGLPGVLIVVTSRKIAYVGWMLIYLLSLPVWNFVLPSYAYWHFDDFSWGQTRVVTGDTAKGHGDKEGEFDSTRIVMKKWAEFERERRWKGGTVFNESIIMDTKRSASLGRAESSRYSTISTDTYQMSSSDITSGRSSATKQPQYYDDNAPLLLSPASQSPRSQTEESASSYLMEPIDPRRSAAAAHSPPRESSSTRDNVRRVGRGSAARHAPQSQGGNRYSRNSLPATGLPPGAAPPRPFGM